MKNGVLRHTKGKVLTPLTPPSSMGYHKVNLWNNIRGVQHYVHRLVTVTFHGPQPTPNHQCAHGDGDKNNNKASNLRWATPKENKRDARKHGGIVFGERHGMAKLNENDVIRIRGCLANGDDLETLAAYHKVSVSNIKMIRDRKSWVYLNA
jgi:hypothetical protein